MKNADIITTAFNQYYTHKERSLVETISTSTELLNWIANAQKELNKLLGA